MKSNYHRVVEEATGRIPYNMTNDYMFRYVLQENKKVLKGLISSLLHLDINFIKSIEVTNPINMSEDISGKDFVLDIDVLLNNDTKINLEMQVTKTLNWPERSLSYLCRSFDQLYRGQDYEEALPVIHIGFLDFTLFPDCPEFYASYMLQNIKNLNIFSSKFKLCVVDLTKIELANEEDKAYEIDYWARLFKAKTWEEIKMLAKENECMQEAVNSIYMANADEMVRQRCLAREEAERHERTMQRNIRMLQDENAELKDQNIELRETIEVLNAQKDQNIEEGIEQSLLKKITKKLAKGQQADQIALALEEEEEIIKQLIEQYDL